MRFALKLVLLAACALAPLPAGAQTAANIAALKGLAPVAALPASPAGQAALAANFTVTGGVQTGVLRRPTLLPFPDQQQQALKDVFITAGDLAELADGLGTTLGAAYVARAHYLDRVHFTSVSPAVAAVIAYALSVSGADSNAGKYFFANGTTDGRTAVSDEAAAILADEHGATDVFGAAYGRPRGTAGADAYGDSRPFQTEPALAPIIGPDYFNVPTDNLVYNRGPAMNLVDSPSFPSGHTTYGYTGALLLALMTPERYPQMIARAAEYGDDRIIVGAHYAMDVIGGRTLATYDVAHLIANDPAYVGQTFKSAPAVADFPAALKAAGADLAAALQAGCGDAVAACARQDIGRFSDAAADEAFVAATQTYGLPIVYAKTAEAKEDVATLAPEAGNLLTFAFPSLSLAEADQILADTEGPGGGFLDDGSPFGVYSRLNLYKAAELAAARAAGK